MLKVTTAGKSEAVLLLHKKIICLTCLTSSSACALSVTKQKYFTQSISYICSKLTNTFGHILLNRRSNTGSLLQLFSV